MTKTRPTVTNTYHHGSVFFCSAPHRLGSHGYEGKRAVWAKEDAERESHGMPDPLAEFTDPLEHDWIKARYKWDKVKKIFYTDPNTKEFMILLVIVILPHYHISF